MSWLEIILSVAVVNLAAAVVMLVRCVYRKLGEVGRLRDYRIALAYVASGKAYPSYETFAMAFINGNDQTMRRHFPEFGAFRARELERMEEDDG